MKKIILTVTNDLNYDQRMNRICNSLAATGYDVLLVGWKMNNSPALLSQSYKQKRLSIFFTKGKLRYINYNLRLFFFLLFNKADCICGIDLDTLFPCYLVSVLRGTKRVYDAHELFCEMKEVVTRPSIYRTWKKLERFLLPKFQFGYTVNEPIADEFRKMYNVEYKVIRNMPELLSLEIPKKPDKYILYQGAVNEGRGFETLIPAMQHVNTNLVICGDGNFMEQAVALAKKYQLENKIQFKGKIEPPQLRNYTLNAWIGITLFDKAGLSNYYSLANRFFDYLHAGIPQLCIDFPVYRSLNNQYECAVLTDAADPQSLANALNTLISDEALYNRLQKNCLLAREVWNWQQEEITLKTFYSNLLK